MALRELLEQMMPVFTEDHGDWQKAKADLQRRKYVLWQASSGLDFTPILELQTSKIYGMHQAPRVIRETYGQSLLPMFSDYSDKHLKNMQYLYDNLGDADPVSLGFKAFHPCFQGGGMQQLFIAERFWDIGVEEMIPLRLFSQEQLESLRQSYPQFHSSVTSSCVPDDCWQAVYLDVMLEYKGQSVRKKLIYFHLENLLFYEQVLVATGIRRMRAEKKCANNSYHRKMC